MTNKEKIKSVIEQDINPVKYYNEIICKIEENAKYKKKNLWIWSLAPVCLIVLLCGFMFFGIQSNNVLNKTFIDEKNNIILNINEIRDNIGAYRLDADVKIVTSNDNINFPTPYVNELIIPEDLNKNEKYIFYTRENYDSKDYNILHDYNISYDNGDDRSIKISYSKDFKPLRDYYFSEDESKISVINDIDLKIYKFENIYFTEFKFNGFNFDIETSNVSEQELVNVLLSILNN